jgi:hypothetical protein
MRAAMNVWAARAWAIVLGLSLAGAAHAHQQLHFHVDQVFSGTATPQSALVATFTNLAAGNGVALFLTGMVGSEFLDRIAFNYGGSAVPTFNFVSGPQATRTVFDSNNVTVGPVGQGGAGFDILLDYPEAAGARFDGADVASVYTITGAGIDESDFDRMNPGGFFAAAHIQAIGPGDGSAFVAAVPEAETYVMLLAGLGLLGFIMSRRRKHLAAAV